MCVYFVLSLPFRVSINFVNFSPFSSYREKCKCFTSMKLDGARAHYTLTVSPKLTISTVTFSFFNLLASLTNCKSKKMCRFTYIL